MGRRLELNPDLGDRIRLLFVEHDASCAELVCTCLERARRGTFEVSQAEQLALAREQLQARAYDALLVDLGHVEGERAAAMDAAVELAGRLPVIVLTGTEAEVLGSCRDRLERVQRCDLACQIQRAVRRYRRMCGAVLAPPIFVRVPTER